MSRLVAGRGSTVPICSALLLISAAWGLTLSPSPAAADSRKAGGPLMEAAEGGDVEAVKRLLDSGAKPNAACDYGATPLIAAAQKDHLRIAERLIRAGADLEARDEDGWTALMQAAVEERPDTIRLLLSRGAAVEARTRHGGTALILAAAHGRLRAALTPRIHSCHTRSRVDGVQKS